MGAMALAARPGAPAAERTARAPASAPAPKPAPAPAPAPAPKPKPVPAPAPAPAPKPAPAPAPAPAPKPVPAPAPAPAPKPAPAPAPAPASRRAPKATGAFPEVELEWIAGLWGDDADRLYLAARPLSAPGLYALARGATGAKRLPVAMAEPLAVTGRGAGDAATLAVVGAHGTAARRVGGAWTVAAAPGAEDLDLVAVAVDDAGDVWCAGATDALFRWHGAHWERIAYPSPDLVAKSLVAGSHGVLYLLASDRLFRFDGKAFTEVGVSSDPPVQAIWYGARSERLWVANGMSELWALDAAGKVRDRYVLPGPAEALTGAPLAGGGEGLALALEGAGVGVYVAGRFGAVPVVREGAVRGLYYDAAADAVYFATSDRVARVSVAGALDGTAASLPAVGTSVDGVKSDVTTFMKETDGTAGRIRRGMYRPGVRVGIGSARPLGRDIKRDRFSIDVALVGRLLPFGEKRGLVSAPELTFSFARPGGRPDYLAGLGWGIGYGLGPYASALYIPRVVAGSSDGHRALGFRHGVSLEILWGTFTLEVAHEVLWVDGATRHDLRVLAGFDVFMVAAAIAVASGYLR